MANEAITLHNRFYILATSARIDDRKRVLKHGDTFGVFDRFGDIEAIGVDQAGLYHQDTRFLSRLALRLEGERPLLLDSTVREDNALFTVDLMNADVNVADEVSEVSIPRGTLHVFRCKVLWDNACHERLRIHNYAQAAVELNFSIEFGADFADLFEVRGTPRAHRGKMLAPRVEAGALVLAYEGLDGRARTTRIVAEPLPAWRQTQACYSVRVEPHAEASFHWTIACELEGGERQGNVPVRPHYEVASQRVLEELQDAKAAQPDIHSSNEQFNAWLNRSLADIQLLRTQTPQGPYPYAGVPWYSTVFGRDGIITALQCLWFDPDLARGVLAYLAAMQADDDDPTRDAQPGKILHEVRAGEMAALREVPFGRYYGSIDATPLFIMLAGAYGDASGDIEFMRMLWPHVERALEWIDRYGDPDGDGFYEYARRTPAGLLQQGWKDSQDSVFHADGSAAEGPIALCEVQGYVFAAKRGAARMAARLGVPERQRALEAEAEVLRQRFEDAFWCDEISTYALALDGAKQPCRVATSNAGHCLFAGIASEERACRVAQTLMSGTSFSGWGIRTVALSEKRYNPMSYHNGSIWPHDNAIIAAGFARYGMKDLTVKVMTGLFEAEKYFELYRLPELFCGFTRRPGEAPTFYPVACAPQAWAAGSVLMCLQACLGLELGCSDQTATFSNPVLPSYLQSLQLNRLSVGGASVDLMLTRHENDVGIDVLGRKGRVKVVTVK